MSTVTFRATIELGGKTAKPTTAVLVIAQPIADGDVAELCARLCRVAQCSGADVIVCDVRALAVDAHSVDALARLQLTARRLGRQIRLHRASRELDDLLAFLGLAAVIGTGALRPRSCADGDRLRREP